MVSGRPTHFVKTLIPKEDENARYAQLYIIDSVQQQNEIRMQHPANENLNPFLLESIIKMMENSHNFYLQAFTQIRDLIKESRAANADMSKISVVFNEEYQRGKHKGRQNAPADDDEVAFVYVDENSGEPPSFHRSFRVYALPDQDGTRKYDDTWLSIMSPHLLPMSYPVLYPAGQMQWSPHMILDEYEGVVNPNKEKGFTLLQHSAAMMQIRENVWRPHLHSGRLFQQWLLDVALIVESLNLDWVKFHQSELQVHRYASLRGYLERRAAKFDAVLDQLIILPSTFKGSDRNMRQSCLDALAIVRDCGGPDLFVTFTANPKWPEITENLKPGEKIADRPDVMNRVFKGKLKLLVDLLITQGFFGRAVAYIYVIEFQKRGKPHAHLLLSLAHEDKFKSKERVDQYISCEIPDKEKNPRLFELVTGQMIHGPCSTNFCKSSKGAPCSKKFPKLYRLETEFDEQGNCHPRRRACPKVQGKNGRWIDNKDVVAYCPALTLLFEAHINVEVVGNSMRAVKYIFKYIFKVLSFSKFIL